MHFRAKWKMSVNNLDKMKKNKKMNQKREKYQEIISKFYEWKI